MCKISGKGHDADDAMTTTMMPMTEDHDDGDDDDADDRHDNNDGW